LNLLRSCILPLLFALNVALVAQQPTVDDALFTVQGDHAGSTPLHLVPGQSVVLQLHRPLLRVYIGDPQVLDSFSPSKQEIVLTARNCGRSSLILWDDAGHSHVYGVSVDLDASSGAQALQSAFPEAKVKAEGREGKLYLTGSVASSADADAAVKLASVYSKQVVNALQIEAPHGKQVELQLRIVEVDRAKAEQFGINFLNSLGRTALSTGTQQFPSTLDTSGISQGQGIKVSDPLNLFLYSYKTAMGLTLKDLEAKQVLQILAEPTLTTMSGVAARFLSGGEFPVPVVQGSSGSGTSVSIQYKPYGVKVDFTPTVNRDGSIHLKVAPEVSALDYTNSVTLSGTTVPALSTRRSETEIEIRSGQSFVMSGLLDRRTTDQLSKMPGIANIPFIGQLFRSKNLNHSTVELVVIVTATIVNPLAPGAPRAVEPRMVVPNLDSNHFDPELQTEAHEKKPADAFYIRISSPTEPMYADVLVQDLHKRGYPVDTEATDDPARVQVRVGPYTTIGQTQETARRLGADGFSAQFDVAAKGAL
jgi:pilus assembly protein CpaC